MKKLRYVEIFARCLMCTRKFIQGLSLKWSIFIESINSKILEFLISEATDYGSGLIGQKNQIKPTNQSIKKFLSLAGS